MKINKNFLSAFVMLIGLITSNVMADESNWKLVTTTDELTRKKSDPFLSYEEKIAGVKDGIISFEVTCRSVGTNSKHISYTDKDRIISHTLTVYGSTRLKVTSATVLQIVIGNFRQLNSDDSVSEVMYMGSNDYNNVYSNDLSSQDIKIDYSKLPKKTEFILTNGQKIFVENGKKYEIYVKSCFDDILLKRKSEEKAKREKEELEFMRSISVCIRRSVSFVSPTQNSKINPTALFHVVIKKDRTLSSVSLTKSSGNSDFDKNIERAITSCSPVPATTTGYFPEYFDINYSMYTEQSSTVPKTPSSQSDSSTAIAQGSQLSQLDGDWYSNEWKYGYTLTNGVGIATSTNSANFKVGDKIIFLKQTSDKTFEGTQVYTDGKFYKITVQKESPDTLFFKGEKNVSWVMIKKAQTSTQSVINNNNPATTAAPVNLPPTTQSKLPQCQDTITKNRTVCFGTLTYPNGEKYVGEFKDGLLHGQGTLTFPDGEKYVGEFKDGQRHGEGTLTSANGAKYIGEFEDGLIHGQGTYTFANGNKYVGEWSNDSGIKGVMTFADGRTATGTVQNAVFNAKVVPANTSGPGVIQEFINLRPQYKQVSFYEDSLKIKPIQISNSENNGKQLTYDVKGCKFSVDTDENKNVIGYELNVSDSCPRFTIEVEGLVFDSKNTTLKKILNQVKSCYSYFFRVEYVIYLGNMYDPRDLNYLELSGVRACNSREIIFTFPENKGIAQWKEKIKNDYGGSDNLPNDQRKEINADRKYNQLAENLWTDQKPSKITIR